MVGVSALACLGLTVVAVQRLAVEGLGDLHAYEHRVVHSPALREGRGQPSVSEALYGQRAHRFSTSRSASWNTDFLLKGPGASARAR